MLASRKHIKRNFALAWPLACNALLVQSMLMIDTLLVAPLGELAVAALGISGTIVAFVLGVEIAIGNGVQLLIGRASGSKSQADLAVAYRSGLFINVSSSVVFFLLLTFFSGNLISAITNNAELALLAESYISITKYIVLISAYTQVCTAYFNGCGNTKIPLIGFLFELPINAVLSYLLIFGIGDYSGLGLAGAAWGSLFAVFLRAVFLNFALKNDKNIDLTYPQKRPFLIELRPQFSEIFPIAANFLVLSIGATVYQLLFAQLDLFSFVAITLIFPWIRAGTQFPNSWAQASAISISQAIGKRDIDYLKDFISKCIQMGLLISGVIAGLFILLSQYIHLIYSDIDPATYSALMVIAPLYIILPVIRAYNTVSGNILRALGQSTLVLKIHLITQWFIALPICAFMIMYLDISIFWAFAMIPIEELLKTIPFCRFKQQRIEALNSG